MSLFINFLQLFEGRMRINLRRRQTRMSQQLLHRIYLRPVVQHYCCERVPQHVRTCLCLRTDDLQVLIHYSVNQHGVHLFARRSLKEKNTRPPHRFSSQLQVRLHGLFQPFSKRNQSRLSSFPYDFQIVPR